MSALLCCDNDDLEAKKQKSISKSSEREPLIFHIQIVAAGSTKILIPKILVVYHEILVEDLKRQIQEQLQIKSINQFDLYFNETQLITMIQLIEFWAYSKKQNVEQNTCQDNTESIIIVLELVQRKWVFPEINKKNPKFNAALYCNNFQQINKEQIQQTLEQLFLRIFLFELIFQRWHEIITSDTVKITYDKSKPPDIIWLIECRTILAKKYLRLQKSQNLLHSENYKQHSKADAKLNLCSCVSSIQCSIAIVRGCCCKQKSNTKYTTRLDMNNKLFQDLCTCINVQAQTILTEPLKIYKHKQAVYLTIPKDIYYAIPSKSKPHSFIFQIWTKAQMIANQAFDR